MSAIYWPEEGTPEFVSRDNGETWTPICTRHGKRTVETTYRFTPWGSHHCPECGTTYLIWTEDWPNYEPSECEHCGYDLDDPDEPSPHHATTCTLHTTEGDN